MRKKKAANGLQRSCRENEKIGKEISMGLEDKVQQSLVENENSEKPLTDQEELDLMLTLAGSINPEDYAGTLGSIRPNDNIGGNASQELKLLYALCKKNEETLNKQL